MEDKKVLGSLLCSTEDIHRRCQLGNFAFATYDKCWLKGLKIHLQTEVRLYDSLVASVCSVMLYIIAIAGLLPILHCRSLPPLTGDIWEGS